jgi:putative photosynthetic complex assembly protein 2
MTTFAAIAFVFVMWSASTAVIFYLDSLPTGTFKYSMVAATLVLAICAVLIWQLRAETSTLAIATSFAAGLLTWGWTEMALYMGYVTGPRKQACAVGCSGVKHFGHAISANLWHEILVIAFALAIYWSANLTAFWCFTILWLMHLSARLNVFLGVRNVSAEFVPDHMQVLKSFLRRRNMNALFPFSCAVLTGLAAWLISRPQSFEITMAATLTIIGLLEHVLLMLPLPTEKIWTWTLSKKKPPETPESNNPQPKNNNDHHHTAVGALS